MGKRKKLPIFVHIPKAGGNYVKDTMRAYGIDTITSPHRAGHYVFGKRKTEFDNCEDWKPLKKNGTIFCVVRNPFDLLVSWYFHGANGFRNEAADCNFFDEFVQKYLDKKLRYKDFCENPFCQLYSDEGEFVPDVVLRQETLSQDLHKFLKKDCGLELIVPERDLPVRDRSLRRNGLHYRMFYTNPEQVKKLEERWKPILDKFGYSF